MYELEHGLWHRAITIPPHLDTQIKDPPLGCGLYCLFPNQVRFLIGYIFYRSGAWFPGPLGLCQTWFPGIELELGLIQTHMAQKPVLKLGKITHPKHRRAQRKRAPERLPKTHNVRTRETHARENNQDARRAHAWDNTRSYQKGRLGPTYFYGQRLLRLRSCSDASRVITTEVSVLQLR